jgi:deazaflavin-dependent oxidoreductase (nitroreductase family)
MNRPSNSTMKEGHMTSSTMKDEHMTNRRLPGRQAQAVVFRLVNVPMRIILGLPFPTPLGKRLMLVHHIGRTTGQHYRQPVSYVRDGDVLLTPGGGNWTRNLRRDEPVHIRLRGKNVAARPELIDDSAEVDRLLGVMAAANPALDRFVPIPKTPDGRLDPASLAAAIEHGFRIVKWRLDQPPNEPHKLRPNGRSQP